MVRHILLFLPAFAFVGSPAFAQADKPKPGRPAKTTVFTPEREAAALTFVNQHHTELSALLSRLQPMNRAEYERAIGDLFDVSESLAQLKQRDPKKHELALDAWKAKSRVELLAAQLASNPSGEIEGHLRTALENQIDVELRQHKYERELAEARAAKAREAIKRLEDGRGKLVEQRYQHLLKKGRSARRAEANAKPKPKPKTNRNAQGDRP